MPATFTKASSEALAEVHEEMRVRGTKEVFLLFSMGSQFDHLIVLMLGKIGVYGLVADPAICTAADVRALAPKGIIISGGPASVHNEPPPFDNAIFKIGIPVLGICLGFQMWAQATEWGEVAPATNREFGIYDAHLRAAHPLFDGFPSKFAVLQSHGDFIRTGEDAIVSTHSAPISAGHRGHLYGVQFHPEVSDTEHGQLLFENFCFRICGAKDRYDAGSAASRKIADLAIRTRGKRVLVALSAGCDSSVVAHLLKRAMGGDKKRLRGVYITGIDRPDDLAYARRHFGNQDWIELKVVDASLAMLNALRGKVTMREKREAMRDVYVQLLNREIKMFDADYIAQGTLYTDEVESGRGHESGARRAQIKLHHNVGLPFKVPELKPLSDCVKDGARAIGREIKTPEELLVRHPFPGPGLLVRIEGEVTAHKLAIARAADGIWIEELRRAGLYESVWQAGAVVTISSHTATKGDDAASGEVVCLWAVWSVNGFTARAAEIPNAVLARADQRITGEIRAVSATSYRLTGKPPATIEWG